MRPYILDYLAFFCRKVGPQICTNYGHKALFLGAGRSLKDSPEFGSPSPCSPCECEKSSIIHSVIKNTFSDLFIGLKFFFIQKLRIV